MRSENDKHNHILDILDVLPNDIKKPTIKEPIREKYFKNVFFGLKDPQVRSYIEKFRVDRGIDIEHAKKMRWDIWSLGVSTRSKDVFENMRAWVEARINPADFKRIRLKLDVGPNWDFSIKQYILCSKPMDKQFLIPTEI